MLASKKLTHIYIYSVFHQGKKRHTHNTEAYIYIYVETVRQNNQVQTNYIPVHYSMYFVIYPHLHYLKHAIYSVGALTFN